MEIIIVKKWEDGSKKLSYKGVEFATNASGLILWCDNWDICETLVNDGLASRAFYKYLYGHVDYTLI